MLGQEYHVLGKEAQYTGASNFCAENPQAWGQTPYNRVRRIYPGEGELCI